MRFKDLSGMTFGKLLVLERVTPQIGRTVKYKCKCECGEEVVVQRSNLQSGCTKSCGKHNYKDLSGEKFGKLLCLEKGEGRKHTNGVSVTWKCVCDCGHEVEVLAGQLSSGRTRSCGCLRREKTKERFSKGYEDISGKYWSSVKGGARKRGLEFEITKEQIWEMFLNQNKKCKLSGDDIIFSLDNEKKTASIDRIDNSKGYTIDNVQILHKDINKMKNNLPQKRFIEICKNIARKNN